MKILIIEEDDNLLKILCRIIQQKGYETDSAESNTAVLEMMNANTYDLVILDIDLSDHDGLATCQSIRKEYVGVPIPVSYTHLRAHETPEHLVCRLLLEKKNNHNNL